MRALLLAGLLLGIGGCTSDDDDSAGPIGDDDTTGVPGDDDSADPWVNPGVWHTDGQRIVDPLGRHRILHGVNLSGDVKSEPYDSWAEVEDYERLQLWGHSVLRLLTGWAAIMPEEGVIDEEYLLKYDQRVDWAEEHGLLVIIDMHQDVYGEGFGGNGAPAWTCDQALYDAYEPTSPWYLNYMDPSVMECFDRLWTDAALQDRFIEAFAALAGRYADREHVIGYDLFNEPHWGTADLDEFHAERLQPFYERVIAALDEVAPDRLYLVEPATMVQWGFEPAFEPFEGPNVVYAPHYYHYGVHDLGEYDGDPEPIEEALDSYQATAERLGTPWILGELGGLTDSVDFDLYLRHLYGQLEKHHAGDTYWDYCTGGGFCVIDADHEDKESVTDALARVYPKGVGGVLVEYAFDDVSGAFSVTLETIEGLDAPTELALPAAHHYPEGLVVESTDADGTWSHEVDEAAGELTFSIDPQVGSHTLSLQRR